MRKIQKNNVAYENKNEANIFDGLLYFFEEAFFQPANFAIDKAYFAPVAHLIQKLKFDAFVNGEYIGAVYIGCAFYVYIIHY